MTNPTIGYFCWLCHEKNELVQQKSALYQEAQSWKAVKFLGKADVCFELYEELKHIITPKSEHIKVIGKKLRAKPVYNSNDYSITAIEMRTSQGYQMIADTPTRIKELAEQYIIESIILGNFDDKP
jgi:hypothetical protein